MTNEDASRPPRILTRRYWVHTLAVLLVIAGGAAAWRVAALEFVKTAVPPSRETTVPVFTRSLVPLASVSRGYSTTGVLEADTSTDVGFEIGGRVMRVEVAEGEIVSEGDELARMDIEYYERLEAEARARYNRALRDYENARDAGESVFPSATIESLQYARDAAEAQLRVTELNREKAILLAPETGILEACYVEPGEVVRAGDPLFRIVRVDPIILAVRVPEWVVALLVEGESLADVEVRAFAGQDIPCVHPLGDGRALITRVAWEADAAHQFRVEISFSNPGRRFRPGMLARAKLVLPPIRNCVVLPLDACVRHGEAMRAWVIVDERALPWDFTAWELLGTDVAVTERPPSYTLVIAGIQEVVEGVRVRKVEAGVDSGEVGNE